MNTISIILPTYNESENIGLLLTDLFRYVPNIKEILVMDDDSPDHTGFMVKTWMSTHKKEHRVKLFIRKNQHGLTRSISEGISKASGDIIVWMDADFSHPPSIIPQLTNAILHGNDVAVASRYVSGGGAKPYSNRHESYLSNTISICANYVMRKLFRIPFHDFTSGFVAVRKKAIASIQLHGEYGEYFIDFIVQVYHKNLHITEIPYTPAVRLYGTTKTAPTIRLLITRLKQYGKTVCRLLVQQMR